VFEDIHHALTPFLLQTRGNVTALLEFLPVEVRATCESTARVTSSVRLVLYRVLRWVSVYSILMSEQYPGTEDYLIPFYLQSVPVH
jgi:hypothetical protein